LKFPILVPGLISLLLLTGCGTAAERGVVAPAETILLGPCERPDDPALVRVFSEAQCALLKVAENPKQPDGRQIELAVMVLPAIARVAKPDPIFYLAGGPGQSAITSGPVVFSALLELRRQREVILVDQRGTGRSNNLSCVVAETPEDFTLSSATALAREVNKLKDCLPTLDADPALYTTSIAVGDLDLVRRALGYEQINLLGISYGTRAALVYLRQFSGHVRSLILDGVAPPSVNILAGASADTDTALDRLFVDCQSSSACAQAFPDLRDHFIALTQRLTDNPVEAEFRHPRTGASIPVTIDQALVARLVRQVLYHRTLSTLLPLALSQANQGDYQALLTLGYQFHDDSDSISTGMMASVFCAEDMTQTSGSTRASQYFANSMNELMVEVCQFWPRGEVAAEYFQAVSSDVPVLLLSGELDPVTPPKYAEQAAQTLANSRHLIVQGVGHNAGFTGCVPDLMVEFMEQLAPQNLAASCLDLIRRPPFFTSAAGPQSQLGVTDD